MQKEAQFIEKAKKGDEKAFNKLYNLHVEPLYRFMKQYSNDTGKVEDWVQQAFIKAFKNIETFRGTSKFSTWLFTIALNEMRNESRKSNIIALKLEEAHESVDALPEDEQFEWRDSMKRLMSGLDEQKKTIFLLYEVEGYSHAEIASMLDIGENASRTMLCRTKQWLRTKWESMEKAI